MEIEKHVLAIQSDLAAAAQLGGDEIAEATRRLADAVAASLQLRIIDVLTDASLALNAQLEDGHVEVRIAGRDPDLVYVPTAPGGAAAEPSPGDDTSARLTLRLPEALKAVVEAAAAREGISTNAWVVRALARSVEARSGRGHRSGSRLQGFASS